MNDQQRDIAPCPFCGHVGLDFSEGSTFRWLSYSCGGCGIGSETRVQTLGDGTREQWLEQAKADAIEAWNTRAITQPKAQQHGNLQIQKKDCLSRWKQQQQPGDPSGIYQMYGAFVACVAGARIPGTYQSWLGARLALALPDDVLLDLMNKAAPNDISDKAVFSAYQEHQKTQEQQAAAVPAARILLLGGVKQVVLTDQGFDLPIGSNLYAAPPAPVLPLSEVDIERGREEFGGERHDFMAGVRFAEKSHGITAHGAGGESTT